MLDLVYCEILKLKRCRIVSFSVLGVMATPLMMFVEALQTHFKHPEQVFTLGDIYDSSLLYVMLLMNMMVYVAITAYLFSREYTEKTLKNLLPIPVSRTALITGKFVTLFIWTLLLTLATWAAIFLLSAVYHGAFGTNGFSIAIGGEWLLKFLCGSVLLFFTLSPFAYIAEKTKGFVIPVITASAIVMGSAALSNQELGALYPWTATFFLIQGKLQATGYPVALSVGIIAAVSTLGFYLTVRYFRHEDIK